ncbi:hypothetical protein [Desulfovibrio ferrophilus]|uniref:Putative phage repressor n=1 Tax=Desulfovibrio ferrophilus TaxID=241368 RepID=A0A2Z6B3T8_9BACT|nr:hypothetical protein [Desulfovibrio ferrophilus]BBD10106.1 putative phage repressor [Desulfovibrio ferrophilus]
MSNGKIPVGNIFDPYKAFASALNTLKDSQPRGLLARLAEATNIRPGTLSKMASGDTQGSEIQRRQVATACGYRYDEFLQLGMGKGNKPVISAELLVSKFSLQTPVIQEPDYNVVAVRKTGKETIKIKIGEAFDRENKKILLRMDVLGDLEVIFGGEIIMERIDEN